jgi:hypothetical protein
MTGDLNHSRVNRSTVPDPERDLAEQLVGETRVALRPSLKAVSMIHQCRFRHRIRIRTFMKVISYPVLFGDGPNVPASDFTPSAIWAAMMTEAERLSLRWPGRRRPTPSSAASRRPRPSSILPAYTSTWFSLPQLFGTPSPGIWWHARRGKGGSRAGRNLSCCLG